MSETTSRPLRSQDIQDGQYRLVKITQARQFINARVKANKPWSWKMVGYQVGVNKDTLYKWHQLVECLVNPTASDLAPKSRNAGRPRERELTEEEVAAIKGPKLVTNRTHNSGSTPEAIRHAIKTGSLPPDLVERIQTRAAKGKPMLNASQMDQVYIPEAITRHFRAPRENWLEIANNPGSLQLIIDTATGEERFIRPGEFMTIDDGTKNFGCCVPLEKPNDPCWLKYRVVVGRFQFLLCVDHRTRFITGFSHTARPKGSYRAEDLTAVMHNTFLQHGCPKAMFLEHGNSAAKLVKETLRRLGVMAIYVRSPHQKVVESVFNKMWTKLSLLPGQVGRFQGEEEELCDMLTRCQSGAHDPRMEFPMLADVLKALKEAIDEHNAELVISRTYSQQWIPKDFFAAEAPQNTRKIGADESWAFSPFISEPLRVRKENIVTTVPFMEGHSVQFAFTNDWVSRFIGAKVKLFFNPFAPTCTARAVLVEPFHGHGADELLGELFLSHRFAKNQRRIFGYGDDIDDGQALRLKNQQAVNRNTYAIRPDGKPGITTHEMRDGIGNAVTVEMNGPARPEPEHGSATAEAQPKPRRATAEALPKPERATQSPEELTAELQRLNEEMRARNPEFAAFDEE